MPVRILLRTQHGVSPFRRAMQALLHPTIGDAAVICSGYIDESPYYSVLSDQLLPLIVQGCPSGVLTVAGKLNNTKYRQKYVTFVQRLMNQGHVAVTARIAPLDNWHSKVFLRIAAGVPVAGIVGSSNLTGPAYGEQRPPTPWTPGWNYEADVIIWNGLSHITSIIRDNNLEQDYGIIDAILDPDVPQPSESEQLLHIYDRIKKEMK